MIKFKSVPNSTNAITLQDLQYQILRQREVNEIIGYEVDEEKYNAKIAHIRNEVFYIDEVNELGETERAPVMSEEDFAAYIIQSVNRDDTEFYKLDGRGNPIPIYETHAENYTEMVDYDDVITSEVYDTIDALIADLSKRKVKIENGKLIETTSKEKSEWAALQTAQAAEQELSELRRNREYECFSVVNRGQLWYDTLTNAQKTELKNWYAAWLDVTDSKVVPNKPIWLNKEL